MSYVLRQLISPIAAMVAIMIIGTATPVRADLEIWFSESGIPGAGSGSGNPYTHGSSSATYNGSFGGNLSINMTATTNGTGSLSVSPNASITNTSSSAVTVYISVGVNGFAALAPPFSVSSSVTGTSASSFAFESYVNNSNGQNATSGGSQGPTSGANSGPQSLNSSVVFTVTQPNVRSMTETFRITLSGKSSVEFASSTSVVASTPEPSSMAIAGLGGLGMIGYSLRRRKAKGSCANASTS